VQLLGFAGGHPLRVLVLGAHADDIEIGCAGTLLRWNDEGAIAEARWVVLSGDDVRDAEARAGARAVLGETRSTLSLHRFRDGFFPYEGVALKETFESIKAAFEPDVILTHRRHDLHQDHSLVAELTSQTFRDHLILEYEVPKWDADLTPPNVYVELTADVARRKAEVIGASFVSQADRHWFSAETFLGLARLRGIECRAPGGYAEAFHARKLAF
jgi:LmbE family N-acetylglucosaminyl deacetylase